MILALLITTGFSFVFSWETAERCEDIHPSRDALIGPAISDRERDGETYTRDVGGTLNMPVWEVGNYWSFRTSLRAVNDEGDEFDEWENRTCTVAAVDELYSGHGTPVECYNLTIAGNVQNYIEAEMDTSEYGFNFGTVPYKSTLDATLSGYMLVEKDSLSPVKIYKEKDGTATIYDLPAMVSFFEGNYDYEDFSIRNYTPPLDMFRLPQNAGDSYHLSARVDYYTQNYLDLQGGQTRTSRSHYLFEDDVVVTGEDITIDHADAFMSGQEQRCLKIVHTENGGELYTDKDGSEQPPDGGTRTIHISPTSGWFTRFTYDDHYGDMASGYVIVAEDYLKDTNYEGREPDVSGALFQSDTVTNSGDESTILKANVTDPDGSLDIDKVEADLSGLGIGMLEMYDDGTHGDTVAGDYEFALEIDILDTVQADTYSVDITAYDLGGNTGTATADLIVETDNEPPQIFSAFFSPTTVYNDGTTEITFTADVSDPNGDEDIGEVLADLTPLGGDAETAMNDDGKDGDPTPGDGRYTVIHVIPESVVPGDHSVEFTAKDLVDETGTLSLDVKVHEFIPIIPPEIVKGECTPENILMEGDIKVLFEVEVRDDNGLDTIVSVEGDLGELDGEDDQRFYDDGTNGDDDDDDGTYSYEILLSSDILSRDGLKEKTFTITVTVTDETYESVTGTINLTAVQPNWEPVITDISADIDSVFNDGKEEVELTVELMDNDTIADIERVWVELDNLDGSEVELNTDTSDVFKTAEFKCTFTVPDSVDAGTYRITISVEDSEGNIASREFFVEVVERHKVDDDDDDDTTPSDDDSDDDTTGDDDDDDTTGDVEESKKESPGFTLFALLLSLLLVLGLRMSGLVRKE